jgi:hypothetical protein
MLVFCGDEMRERKALLPVENTNGLLLWGLTRETRGLME